MDKIKKTRHLQFDKYFEILQKEYIVAELRSKIYKKPRDRNYYLFRELPLKRDSIIKIAERNSFKSIFTDLRLYEQYKSEILPEWGLPNFLYRSPLDRKSRRTLDILYYFSKGCEVSVLDRGVILKGKVKSVDLERSKVLVEFENSRSEYISFELITRFLW